MNPNVVGPIRSLGEILIHPPIPLAELGERCPFTQNWDRMYPFDVRLVISHDPADETLTGWYAIAIVPAAGLHQGHRLLRDLQQIVDDYGAGRTFTGRFNRTRLDDEAQTRVKIVDGKAMEFTPTITWPGESE